MLCSSQNESLGGESRNSAPESSIFSVQRLIYQVSSLQAYDRAMKGVSVFLGCYVQKQAARILLSQPPVEMHPYSGSLKNTVLCDASLDIFPLHSNAPLHLKSGSEPTTSSKCLPNV